MAESLADRCASRWGSGLLLTICASKTGPDRRGQVVGVAALGQHPTTDPIPLLVFVCTWLVARGTAPGRPFTSMRPGEPRPAADPATPSSGSPGGRTTSVGLPTALITGHSLHGATPAPRWPASASNPTQPRPATSASTFASSAASAPIGVPCTASSRQLGLSLRQAPWCLTGGSRDNGWTSRRSLAPRCPCIRVRH